MPIADGRYARELLASWRTMDFNGHMGNTAYLDLAADVRLAFFAEHGFPATEFRRRAFGPVVRKDEIEYFREVSLHDIVTVTLAVRAMSPDGARFALVNEFWSAEGDLVARVQSSGGWLDLTERKLMIPPPELQAVMRLMPRTADFEELPERR